jgi:hypothetical protein
MTDIWDETQVANVDIITANKWNDMTVDQKTRLIAYAGYPSDLNDATGPGIYWTDGDNLNLPTDALYEGVVYVSKESEPSGMITQIYLESTVAHIWMRNYTGSWSAWVSSSLPTPIATGDMAYWDGTKWIILSAPGAIVGSAKTKYLKGTTVPAWDYQTLGNLDDVDFPVNPPAVAQGAIFFYNGTDWTFLNPDSTAGKALLTQGASADPIWGTVVDPTKIPTTYLDTDETLAANSDSKIATQQATKAYVDNHVTDLTLPHPTVIATTTASKGGVFNGDFELTPPFTAVQIATRWIDGTAAGSDTITQYGWFFYTTAGTTSCRFDPTVSYSGKTSFKLSNVDTSGRCQIENVNVSILTAEHFSKHAIRIKPSVKYKLSAFVKTINVAADSVYIRLAQYDIAASLGTQVFTSKLTGTNDWTYLSVTFTSDADAEFGRLSIYNIIAGNVSDAWFDEVRLEEVISDTGYTGTIPTPLLSTITGVTSTDSIDQSLDPTFAAAYHYDLTNAVNEGATHRQTFTPTKNHVYSIKVKVTAKGTGNWTMVVHDATNAVIASQTIANASLANTTITEFTVPCLWTTGAYHFHLYSSVADGTVVVGTADHDLETCSFIEYYAKPTENYTQICNGVKTSLSADADGILGGAIIDLDKGKYLYVNPFNTYANFNDIYSASAGGETTSPVVVNGWTWSNTLESLQSASGATARNVVFKVNTLLPIKGLIITPTMFNNNSACGLCEISIDNVNYTTLWTLATSASAQTAALYSDIAKGLTTFYVRISKDTTNQYIRLDNLRIEADLDTSALPVPQVYPLATNQFSDEVILPSVATRIYFRLIKFCNSNGVVVPHLEFTDASAVVIKAIPIRIDNSQETNPAIAIVIADTLYGQASGTGSTEGGNYILNDGEYMTLSTATAVPRVTWLVGKGTTAFSNITKNIIYLSSNGVANDATKDPSHQMSVTHWYRLQSLAKTVNDVVRKVSDIANSLIPNSSFDIQFIIDGGGVTPTVASKGFITVPSKCVVTGWTLLGDAAGAIVVDVHSCAYSGFPTTTTIWASKPTIAATNQQAQTLGTLAIPLNKGDVLEIAVDSVTTITRCTLSMHCERVR